MYKYFKFRHPTAPCNRAAMNTFGRFQTTICWLATFLLIGYFSAAQGPIDSKSAVRFALKPKINELDSIRIYRDFFEKKNDLRNWLRLHFNVGGFMINDKKTAEGLGLLIEGYNNRFRKPENPDEWNAWHLLNLQLGLAYKNDQENMILVRNHYEISRAVYQDTLRKSDLFLAKTILIPLGNAHARLRDFEKAFYYFEQAKKIGSRYKDVATISGALNSKGVAYNTKGETQKAAECYQEGLSLTGLNQHRLLQLSINLAEVLIKLNQVDSALAISLRCQLNLERN